MLLLLLSLFAADTSDARWVMVAPAESLAVTVEGRLHGPTVVLLPGLFGSSFGYRHVMKELGTLGYWTVGIEPLGMGSSSRPEDANYSLTAQADRVAATLDTLGVSRTVLVGHSLGASVAMRVAYRRPDLVRGIVSLEGGPGETATTKGFRRWMRFAPVVRMLDARRLMQQMLFREMRSVSFDEDWVNQQVVMSYTVGLMNDYRATIGAYRQMARSEEPELLREHLSSIKCPVILFVGDAEHDSGPSDDEVALLQSRLPTFVVDTVPRSGYFIQEENPAAVVEAVRGIDTDHDCGGL